MKWLKQCFRKPSLAAVGRLDWKAEVKGKKSIRRLLQWINKNVIRVIEVTMEDKAEMVVRM